MKQQRSSPVSVEEQLRSTNALLDGLRDVHQAFLRGVHSSELFDNLLRQLLELTESEYGFIGEVHQREDGTPFLQTHAITNIAWNEETRQFYEEHGPQGMRFLNLQTLFGVVMTSERPVIANDPGRDARSGGLPPGHPDLNAFLGLPFFKGKEMVGMVGMANRAQGYDDALVEFLEPVMVTCAGIIEAHRSDRSRQAAEAEVREREERLDSLVESLVDAVISIDESGVVDSVNSAALEMFGYSEEELVGRNISMLMPSPYHEEHDGYLENYFRTGVKRIIGLRREAEGLRKDGRSFPIELGISEAWVHGRRMFTGVLRDITQRRTHELSLRENAETLRRKNREQEEFLHVANHDLQEPLRRLRTYSALLQQDAGEALNDDAETDLEFIVEAASQMHALVRDLSVLATTNTEEPTLSTVSLEACLDDCLSRLTEAVRETGARIERDSLPDVRGDKRLLGLVLENLISNAIKFSEGEAPRIQFTTRTNGGLVNLRVRDHGIGVDPEHAEAVFAPFRRLHSKGEYEGSGIGLSLCRKALEQLGGTIELEQPEGAGACFSITLRAANDSDS